jgi:hypothetical protein
VKTDQYIKEVVVAAIRRHGRYIDTWVGTRLWDQGDFDIKAKLSVTCALDPEEQPILYSYIDPANWTLVTTRRIWGAVDDRVRSIAACDVVERRLGNFKGHGGQAIERMQLRCRNGQTYWCPYETGYPSMGTIHAVRTLSQLIAAK